METMLSSAHRASVQASSFGQGACMTSACMKGACMTSGSTATAEFF